VPQPGGKPPAGIITISENHNNSSHPASPGPGKRLGTLGPDVPAFVPGQGGDEISRCYM
jgi:hypothetical protein